MGRGKARASLDLVNAAKTILKEIQPASIRAVCYKLFTLGLLASMKKAETNKVSRQLTWAREIGFIPWAWIVDETREAERAHTWANPTAFLEAAKRSYRRDRWTDQPAWVEVWSEKGTIRGTLAPILDEFGVTFRVMHGYGSSTAVHGAAMETRESTKRLTVLYVGDWDPSGLHMSQVDLPERLVAYGGQVDLRRVALTQIDTQGDLPSFNAETKTGDPRYRWFRDCYGSQCWELDALDPNLLRERIEDAIVDRLDLDAWDRAEVADAAERESMAAYFGAWPGISGQVSKYHGDRP
ncbi:MAG: hypothetical protein ABR606_00630 [Vicinamibacterales bacterium]